METTRNPHLYLLFWSPPFSHFVTLFFIFFSRFILIQCLSEIFGIDLGSVEAQKLLFEYSEKGNLLPYLTGHFDTTIGNVLVNFSLSFLFVLF
jgi:hypothetical protein